MTRAPPVLRKVHYILASIGDGTERFEVIGAPPLDQHAKVRRWMTSWAKKHVGQSPDRPETVPPKVAAIHRLADDEVAAEVASDVLRRPEVASRVVADLVGACHRFLPTCGKTVAQLRDRHLPDDERAVLAQNVTRCRAVWT
ncbi:DUF6192 family protein [Streptomyces sp. NPDC054813]